MHDGTAPGLKLAAGALANFARRSSGTPVEPSSVTSAVRRLAQARGISPWDLRLTDYRQALGSGFPGPTLEDVMATFGTWRNVRAAGSQTMTHRSGPQGQAPVSPVLALTRDAPNAATQVLTVRGEIDLDSAVSLKSAVRAILDEGLHNSSSTSPPPTSSTPPAWASSSAPTNGSRRPAASS